MTREAKPLPRTLGLRLPRPTPGERKAREEGEAYTEDQKLLICEAVEKLPGMSKDELITLCADAGISLSKYALPETIRSRVKSVHAKLTGTQVEKPKARRKKRIPLSVELPQAKNVTEGAIEPPVAEPIKPTVDAQVEQVADVAEQSEAANEAQVLALVTLFQPDQPDEQCLNPGSPMLHVIHSVLDGGNLERLTIEREHAEPAGPTPTAEITGVFDSVEGLLDLAIYYRKVYQERMGKISDEYGTSVKTYLADRRARRETRAYGQTKHPALTMLIDWAKPRKPFPYTEEHLGVHVQLHHKLVPLNLNTRIGVLESINLTNETCVVRIRGFAVTAKLNQFVIVRG
jgi:hypothetical protein